MTCSPGSVAFDEEAFVVVQAVVLFEVLVSANVVTAEEFVAPERELDEFHQTIVDGFVQSFALNQELASVNLEELHFHLVIPVAVLALVAERYEKVPECFDQTAASDFLVLLLAMIASAEDY